VTVIATPAYFKSGAETLFGWLHQPPAALRTDAGLVICKPFGYEAICAHGSLRAFADACAAIGVTVLRFDYAGTGDSSGVEGSADQIAQWCDDIRAAIEALRRMSAVKRVALLGMRLGALLASQVAARSGAAALIAIAPVTNGRRYLRELRAYQATAQATAAEGAAEPIDGALEVTGFSLSAASVASLLRADLLAATVPAAPRALILDRSDLPGAKPWADALHRLGAEVRYRSLSGFPEMVATPHAAQIPQAMIAATVEWLTRWAGPAATATPTLVPEASMRLAAEDGFALTERAVFIDEQRTLFAILTAPAQPAGAAAAAYGVVMLNGGATSHIGPNRMYVELARRWAARGYVVLRLDLAGLGDSATRPGRSGNEVYPPGALEDIAVAIEYLRGTYGVENITLAGLCAGAYHALRSATSGLPVNTVLLVNPLTFYWKQGSTLNDLQISEVVRNPSVYAEHILVGQAWLRVLRGRVNLARVAMVLLRRAWLALDGSLRDLTRLLHVRLPHDLGWDLQSIAARGVRIVFLFARGDGGADLLRVQGGSAVKAIGDRCRIHTIDGADHVFSQRAPRQQLLQLLSSELPR
jgi:alpha-beta hydrolase superfamily lysophospholipase